ncbi:MAG: M23 family metallopeptidase [Oligoflexia bacterium]|nr:M23 family metallopeptidase [Oligoflexia bacterium]
MIKIIYAIIIFITSITVFGIIGLVGSDNAHSTIKYIPFERPCSSLRFGFGKNITKTGLSEQNEFNEFYVSLFGPIFNSSIPFEDYHVSMSVRKGQTLIDIFKEASLPLEDAYWAANTLGPLFGPRALRPGQRIDLEICPDKDYTPMSKFMGLRLYVNSRDFVLLKRISDKEFVAEKFQKKLTRKIILAEGVIANSLYEAFREAQVPSTVMMKFFDLYSFQVDFQRDIEEGDSFEVLYESFYDENGEWVESGKIYYLSLDLKDSLSSYYSYKTFDGSDEYFNEEGEGIKKALLKTPTSAVRISSNFGRRRHPVLGYNHSHKGVDFSSPRGTPIWAAGDGIVTYVGRIRGYGKIVKIRHNDTFSTAYAHMSKFLKGLKVGKRVKQKDIIGYVGATGRTTGPHLHYEIWKNESPVNPMALNMPSNYRLKANEWSLFQQQKGNIDGLLQAGESSKRVENLLSKKGLDELKKLEVLPSSSDLDVLDVGELVSGAEEDSSSDDVDIDGDGESDDPLELRSMGGARS